MSRMPWFRVYHEARTDAKLRSLADDEFRVWFNLLCYAAEQDDQRGTIDCVDYFLLAVEVAGGDEQLLAMTLQKLERLRIIEWPEGEENDGPLVFSRFEDRQYDKPSDTPEQTRERKARQREKERDTPSNKEDVTPESRDVTPSHAQEKSREDTDTDTDTEKSREEKEPSPAAPSRASPNLPFEALLALCDATGADVGELSASVKSKQLGKAKQLLGSGMTVDEIGRCAHYLSSESWRTGTVDMFTVEKDRGKWELAGKPAEAKSRASPNGSTKLIEPKVAPKPAYHLVHDGERI